MVSATIVYTSRGMLLTKAEYPNWRAIQDQFVDYVASLGPWGTEELVEFLDFDYPTVALFRPAVVRRFLDSAEEDLWHFNEPRPSGNGLKLGVAAGDSLRLAITGYQFPDHEDPRIRYSWYMVEGVATSAGREWRFHSQALTCDAAPLISIWLRDLSAWARSGLQIDPPPAPWLIEPNIQFPSVIRDGELLVLTVQLDLEFLPPERQVGTVGAGTPEVLEIRATPDELETAAKDLDATIARYPTGGE